MTGRMVLPGMLALTLSILSLLAAAVCACAGSRALERERAIGIEWVDIPGAAFDLGDTFDGTNQDALPVHRVRVESYGILRYEVTYRQYDAFARATGRRLPDGAGTTRGDRAVVDVDWDDAVAFCAWIGARLPSEREWEFAAAGGPAKQLFPGTSDPDSVDAYVRHRVNGLGMPGIVGRHLPNLYGLHDMGGNVAEWVGAFYQFYPADGEEPDWVDTEQSGIRIVRGGSFSMDVDIARTYWRAGTLREVSSPAIGFRCARDR